MNTHNNKRSRGKKRDVKVHSNYTIYKKPSSNKDINTYQNHTQKEHTKKMNLKKFPKLKVLKNPFNLNKKLETEVNTLTKHFTNKITKSKNKFNKFINNMDKKPKEKKYNAVYQDYNNGIQIVNSLKMRMYDCYEGNEYKFTELDFSDDHHILKNNSQYQYIVSKLKKYYYVKEHSTLAIIRIFGFNGISIDSILKIKTDINGVKFLNKNYLAETEVYFQEDKNTTIANIIHNNQFSVIYLNGYNNIPKITKELFDLQSKFNYVYDTSIIIDLLLKHKIKFYKND